MPAFTRARAHYPVTRPRRFVRPAGLTAPVQAIGPAFRGVDGFGCECNGGYVYRTSTAPVMPAIAGQFGQYGTLEWLAPTIQAVATTALTVYQIDQQRRLAITAQHEQERQAAAAAEAAAKASAQQQANAISSTAAAQVAAGVAPTGSGVLAAMQGVPVWVWGAAGGGLLLLMLLGRRRAA